MVRRYLDTPVGPDAVDRIVEAGRRAPSAGNTRGTHFVVATGVGVRERIALAAGEPTWVGRGKAAWLSTAPVHIVIAADPVAYDARYRDPDKHGSTARTDSGAWAIPWWWVDAGSALMGVLLAAVDEDLAAGFLGGHAFEDLHEVVGMPETMEIVGVVTVGHPHPDDAPTGSALLGPPSHDEVVHYERWHST